MRRLALPYYEAITGAGPSAPWLVVVHGATQHSGLFSAQVETFRASRRLLLVDLPGHGRSSNVPGPYGLAEYARSVMAALDESRVDEAHFWGTHTGAGIGLLLAARHPGRFTSLVVDGAIRPSDAPRRPHARAASRRRERNGSTSRGGST